MQIGMDKRYFILEVGIDNFIKEVRDIKVATL